MSLFGRKKAYEGPAADELDDMAVMSAVKSFLGHASVLRRDGRKPGYRIAGEAMIEHAARGDVKRAAKKIRRLLTNPSTTDAQFRDAMEAFALSTRRAKELGGVKP